MSTAREIVTLQFGNYANYVGSHLWNIQESSFNYDPSEEVSEIEHDVFYREGVNANRQITYTPRLLLVDLEGALKHLPREGELYGNSVKRGLEEVVSTEVVKKLRDELDCPDEAMELIEQPVAAKHDFQRDLDNPEINVHERDYQLAENVESWADYLYARYHPRTVHVVRQCKHSPDRQTFDTHTAGVQLWRSEQFSDDFCDHIRQYVEECDYLQGFQTIFDAFNGFSGLATSCLQHLNDEYDKANFSVPLYSPRATLFQNADDVMSDSIRVANSLLSFQQLSAQASLFVPLSTTEKVWRQLGEPRKWRSLNYQADNLYQTSAILATYLDTIALRFSLRLSNGSLGAFCSDMNNYGRRFAAAGLALPFAMPHDLDLIDCLDKFEGPLFTPLTPNCAVGDAYVVQALSVRGIPAERLKRPREQAQRQMQMAAYKCSSVSEMFQLYLQCNNHASLAHVTAAKSPLALRLPFPNEIFLPTVNTQGFLQAQARQAGEKVLSAPALATVQSSSELSNTLDSLHLHAKRIKIGKLHRFKAAGLEEDEYNEALEQLLLFKDNYEDNFEL